MVSFAWPWIFLLLPLPLLLSRKHDQRRPANAISVPPRLSLALDAIPSGHHRYRLIRLLLLWAAWLSLLFALAQPSVPGSVEAQAASGRTLILAIDLSSSMERKDFRLEGEAVDRLTVVKQLAENFILNRRGDRIGLVLFSTETFIASPPSFDLASVARILASSDSGMAGRSTAIGDAIGLSIKTLHADPAKDKAIILLSDGSNNAGSAEPESAARLAKTLNIAVHTIGIMGIPEGDQTGSSRISYTGTTAELDEETLASVAKLSGGKFFRASSTAQLQAVYNEIDQLEGAEVKPPAVLMHFQLAPLFILSLLIVTITYLLMTLRPDMSG